MQVISLVTAIVTRLDREASLRTELTKDSGKGKLTTCYTPSSSKFTFVVSLGIQFDTVSLGIQCFNIIVVYLIMHFSQQLCIYHVHYYSVQHMIGDISKISKWEIWSYVDHTRCYILFIFCNVISWQIFQSEKELRVIQIDADWLTNLFGTEKSI